MPSPGTKPAWPVGPVVEADEPAGLRVDEAAVGRLVEAETRVLEEREVDAMTTEANLGIRLDASSDHNFVEHSDLSDGAVDEGTGNCWRNNTPDVFGCP